MIVDSNILIDWLDGKLPSEVENWLLDRAAAEELVANDIVFAEISGRYETIEAVQDMLSAFGVLIVRLSLEDCFQAGKAFRLYRRRGGTRDAILPDFLIGAQAAHRGWPLVTRDRKGFASYFPEVELIDPFTADL